MASFFHHYLLMTKNINNLRFRPLRFPQFFEAWKAAEQNNWNVFEIDFLKDKQDWVNKLSDKEKRAITRALTAFTQIEQLVGEYWSSTVVNLFSQYPEIIMMARKFSAQESNHFYSYNFLEEVLGLDTFNAFLQDEEALNKVNTIINNDHDPMTSLGVFSGAIERVSLFTSFAILSSFARDNKMKSLKEIMGWSAVDEECHATNAIELFNIFKDQYGYNANKIYEGFDAIVKNEEVFIRYIMDNEDLPSITLDAALSYLYYRANETLEKMELDGKRYHVKDLTSARELNEEMLFLTVGKSHGDFFAGKLSDGYTSVCTQDFKMIDYSSKLNMM